MRLEGFEENGLLTNELFNYKGICRTAPATQGLLNMHVQEFRVESDLCRAGSGFYLSFWSIYHTFWTLEKALDIFKIVESLRLSVEKKFF